MFLAICSVLVAIAEPVAADSTPAAGDDRALHDRAASLIHAWSAVRVFHPWAGEDPKGWDAAFVRAAERILDDSSCEAFAAAISEMFEHLDDPYTVLDGAGPAPRTQSATPPDRRLKTPGLSWIDETTVRIDATDWVGLTVGAGGLNAMHAPMFMDAFAAAEGADTIIVDLRRPAWDGVQGTFDIGGYMLSAVLRREIPELLNEPITLPARASRQHYGFANQGITSEIYHSGHYIRQFRTVERGRSSVPRTAALVFWINEPRSPSHAGILDLLEAIQLSGNGVVIAASEEEVTADPFADPRPLPLACDRTAIIRTAAMVNPDGSSGFTPRGFVAADSPDAAWVRASKAALARTSGATAAGKRRFPITAKPEPTYPEMTFPAREYRLLALAKFWLAFNYFSPYLELTEGDWGATLKRFVPEFLASASDVEYVRAIAKLAVETNDSHTSVSTPILRKHLGEAAIPLIAREIEGKSVVVWAGEQDELAEVRVGDIVEYVDGQTVEERLRDVLDITPGSNRAARVRNAHASLFSGPPGSTVALTLRKESGESLDIELPRAMNASNRWQLYGATKTAGVADVLADNISYIDLARLGSAELQDALETVASADHLIFDMRGYPNLPISMLLAHVSDSSGIGARMTVPIVRTLSATVESYEESYQEFAFRSETAFTGNVAILVNRWTQSAAEHTALYLKAAFADRAVILGEPSAGANGTITYTYLPGGVTVAFTGMAAEWPDGSQLQRVGIQPDTIVRPTIAGVRDGRDEVLEAAIRVLKPAASAAGK